MLPAAVRAHPKISIGSVLTACASVATILTFVTSTGGHSSPVGYPANVQANYLNGCDAAGGGATACQCTLTWFEQHVSLQQFTIDDQQAAQGVETADEQQAIAACS